ncbi:5-formyltetrahydrofolate cyclo-ligase [Silicimonas algicola]|uniref:5-formyltetrahydrofolate cyclo-ligase n=1 Tax=Silicimonas algicola TaxID=1826607 RepID=A0A316G6P8_9RHOB|nr:5-formyltetrahydrofolate cyclo-ligase [Silicimonas algicola]AZQ69413.1 5-formyltetrahydrofolate cyclo-ligase [Silicimonas algicola]PWK56478.1 5-formyltetrahydrofolate cyclo-ligase [Silicimonas algicola]
MDDDTAGEEACLAHNLVAGQPVDSATARDVARFRKAERERLYEVRRSLRQTERAELTADLVKTLDSALSDVGGISIAVYWPIRGEPDLRGWMAKAHENGASVLLPVVVRKSAPLVFRKWSPGCAMERGFWNIPVPAGDDEATPQVVISPLVGVDEQGYRLGNGGGYYDRTLAALDPRPRILGVGFPGCRMKTIYPMPWDIPMDEVVLGD